MILILNSTDNEITYRQELETKLKELIETTSFEKKLLEQEIENSKSQLSFSNETVEQLGKKTWFNLIGYLKKELKDYKLNMR